MNAIPAEAGGNPAVTNFNHFMTRFSKKIPDLQANHRICSDIACGGTTYCLHRFVPKLSTIAVYTWRLYDAPSPLTALNSDVTQALDVLEYLTVANATIRDLHRCGATPEVLAALGYSIRDLVKTLGYVLEDVISEYQLSWRQLMMLSFHPSLLRFRNHFPIIILSKQLGMTAELLTDTFSFSYQDLMDWGVNQSELFYLGFTAATLQQIGMRGEHIAHALAQPDIDQFGGPRWWIQNMKFSKPMFLNTRIDKHIFTEYPNLRAFYSTLVVYFDSELDTRIQAQKKDKGITKM